MKEPIVEPTPPTRIKVTVKQPKERSRETSREPRTPKAPKESKNNKEINANDNITTLKV